MKIRSKALYNYLLDADVLNGTKEAIAEAKRNYRTQYKRAWKKRSRPRKEIRFEVTVKQYQAIKANALSVETRTATYCKRVVLSTVDTAPLIPRQDALLRVLQLAGMALNAIHKSNASYKAIAYLEQAEQQLLQYLNIKN